jgi:hypothetical protein
VAAAPLAAHMPIWTTRFCSLAFEIVAVPSYAVLGAIPHPAAFAQAFTPNFEIERLRRHMLAEITAAADK